MIVTSVMVPIKAFLILTFKTKQLFIGALVLLLIGTVCASCSGSFIMLLLSRMLQDSGTGMMNTVLLVVPKEKIGAVMVAFGIAIIGLIL